MEQCPRDHDVDDSIQNRNWAIEMEYYTRNPDIHIQIRDSNGDDHRSDFDDHLLNFRQVSLPSLVVLLLHSS
jgi:hypothetical protein